MGGRRVGPVIQDIFEYNADWARRQTQSDPEYFHRLAAGQHPTYLWIGCSDSRVPANTITGLAPGEVFVHRNIANLINEADTNALAVIEFAVDVLCVKNIIVCGHYGCGGIRAAMHETGSDTIDRWLDPVRDTARRFADELLAIGDEDARLNLLCERSTEAQVERVARLDIVRKAWERGQRVAVHGWVYGLEDGRLRDLGCSQPTPAATRTS